MPTFRLIVNGEPRTVDADKELPLLWALRDHLGLTGTKMSCERGLCGACIVHLEGEVVRSCQVTVADAAGRRQSDLLAETLLDQAGQPRDPNELQTRLDHLFIALGLTLTLQAGILPQEAAVEGDGTAEPSGASGRGYRACDCPAGSNCDCPRDYLSQIIRHENCAA